MQVTPLVSHHSENESHPEFTVAEAFSLLRPSRIATTEQDRKK